MDGATKIRRIAPALTLVAAAALVAPLGAGELAVVGVAVLCLAVLGAVLGRFTYSEPRPVRRQPSATASPRAVRA
jgi:VIT1/CCC1 family predicted Fe2+/Mn2+ transporter